MTQSAVKTPGQGHIPALDGIRGLAILLVLCVHFLVIFTPTSRFEHLLVQLGGYGTLGIDLFFLLSGFLITGILIDTRGKAGYFKNFYIRRSLRIFPVYYLVLAVIYGTLAWLPHAATAPYAKMLAAQPWAWSYLFNFFIAHEGAWTVPYIGHFWSLAVEEQFYLVWPLVVFYLSSRRLLQTCLVLIVLSTACHFSLDLADISPISIHVLTPCRINALCLGALLATWLRQPATVAGGLGLIRRRALWLVGASLAVKVLIVGAVMARPESTRLFESLRVLSWLGLFAAMHLGAVAASAQSLLSRLLTNKPLRFLGQYSYGIYIFHHFISWPSAHYGAVGYLTGILGSTSAAVLTNATAGMALSIAIAWCSYHLFEKHFLKLKDVLAPNVKVVLAPAA